MKLFDIEKPVIKGYPELRWTGKRPFTSTQFFPAQLKECYGNPDASGWMNKIYWGDNIQVMSHLLKDYRGKINLIYIDPPFDSKAEYKKKIKLNGTTAESDISFFEEKQYGDIWTNDEYLQFMYERLLLIHELLADDGSLYIHLDYHRDSAIRLILDEIFGPNNFQNEIIWALSGVSGYKSLVNGWVRGHDTILFYTKNNEAFFNKQYLPYSEEQLKRFSSIDKDGRRYKSITKERKLYLDEAKGVPISDVWSDIASFQTIVNSPEITNYPTQKPEKLVERIMLSSSKKGDLVFDCFMGSGTTQAVALKLGRRFIGADINLGAIQTTTKRLLNIIESNPLEKDTTTGFEVYNVNNYDFFNNPIQARDLLIDTLQVQRFDSNNVFDGELEGRNVKIMPVNHIATKADLENLISNLPYKLYQKRQDEKPDEPVDRITLVCMGHEPDLAASFQQRVNYKIDVQIEDILLDKREIELKRDSRAEIAIENNRLVIKSFYPMNLLQKLSLQKESVEDWRQLADSIMIDWNYDGSVLRPEVIDNPGKNQLVAGTYVIPAKHGRIRVKITDLLSQSLEIEAK